MLLKLIFVACHNPFFPVLYLPRFFQWKHLERLRSFGDLSCSVRMHNLLLLFFWRICDKRNLLSFRLWTDGLELPLDEIWPEVGNILERRCLFETTCCADGLHPGELALIHFRAMRACWKYSAAVAETFWTHSSAIDLDNMLDCHNFFILCLLDRLCLAVGKFASDGLIVINWRTLSAYCLIIILVFVSRARFTMYPLLNFILEGFHFFFIAFCVDFCLNSLRARHSQSCGRIQGWSTRVTHENTRVLIYKRSPALFSLHSHIWVMTGAQALRHSLLER